MMTNEERDYMYYAYASDPSMRLNLMRKTSWRSFDTGVRSGPDPDVVNANTFPIKIED